MTDPLIEVAEQMERFADSGAGHLTPSAVGQIAARIRAWIEANKCANCGANPPHYCYSCWEKSK